MCVSFTEPCIAARLKAHTVALDSTSPPLAEPIYPPFPPPPRPPHVYCLGGLQFFNSYVSLFYIAFVEPFTTSCTYDSCLNSLCQSLGIIFCVRLLVANTIEVYLPRLKMRYKAKKVL